MSPSRCKSAATTVSVPTYAVPVPWRLLGSQDTIVSATADTLHLQDGKKPSPWQRGGSRRVDGSSGGRSSRQGQAGPVREGLLAGWGGGLLTSRAPIWH